MQLDPEFALTLHELTVEERELRVNDLLHSRIAGMEEWTSKLLCILLS